MPDQPRRHHFIPQFYLAGFTKEGSADGDLYVLDQGRQKTWKSSPLQTAHKRDFHAIDAGPTGDPMVVEKALSVLEGRWTDVVRRVVQQRALPGDDSFGDLMIFVAFMAVRVLRIREILSDFVDRVSKAELFAVVATEESRKKVRNDIEAHGGKMTDEEFVQLLSFVRSGQFDVDLDQTWHVQEMIRMAVILAPLLSLRRWALWASDENAPDLICSDSPVAPRWMSPVPESSSPGFGTPNTIISVPLNRRLALVSAADVPLSERRLDRADVATVNSATAMYANQLYASGEDFVWTMSDGQVGNSGDLLRVLRAEPGK